MATRYPQGKWLGQTPNVSGRFASGQPTILTLHYTAGSSGLDSAKFLMKPSTKASAPFVVDRDGAVFQISEIDIINWHAGVSKWKGLSGLNKYAVGIEFANLGFMRKVGDKWLTGASKFKSEYKGTNGVGEAAHKNEPNKIQGWERYTEPQIESGLALAAWLLKQFPTIKEIVGHDDISPGRKSDPGPMFPMSRFQALLSGGQAAPVDHNAAGTHVVMKGESLWAISRKYGFSGPAEIIAANPQIKNPADIKPGQEITIPRPVGE